MLQVVRVCHRYVSTSRSALMLRLNFSVRPFAQARMNAMHYCMRAPRFGQRAPEAVVASADACPIILLAGIGIVLVTQLVKLFETKQPIIELVYTPVWGRAEPIRLALAAADQEWRDVHFGSMEAMKAKAGTADCPFGQVPVCIDGDLKIAQMDAIMCHIGRKFGLYGSNLAEASQVDMVMFGVEDLRKQYLKVVYENADQVNFVENHINPATMKGRNGGAHFSFLAGILERNRGGRGYIVGTKLSIADVQVYNICTLLLRPSFGHDKEFAKFQPLLTDYVARIEAEPRIARYVETRQGSNINGNDRG